MNNFNTVTNAAYAESNQKHLETHKKKFTLSSDSWAGYKQWQDQNRQVKKGEKSCTIYMFCKKKDEQSEADKAAGKEVKKRTVMKSLRVFNYEQTEAITTD